MTKKSISVVGASPYDAHADPDRLWKRSRNAAMQQVHEWVERVAPTDTSVLVLGETGTGKELVVRALHANSLRAGKPFVIQNCAGMPESLLESELFGHRRGAFTGAHEDRDGLFAAADGGTLFLDEIAETSVSMQAKLLRVLQSGELRRVGDSVVRHVDVRLLGATHADLQQKVTLGQFREDLYYRIATFVIRLPPLRDRREDVADLLLQFIAEFSTRHRRETLRIDDAALTFLLEHRWPGNVRQLRQIVERLAILQPAKEPVSLGQLHAALAHDGAVAKPEVAPGSFHSEVARFERSLIMAALERSDGVLSRAAQFLGLDRSTLSRRCHKLGIVLSDSEGK